MLNLVYEKDHSLKHVIVWCPPLGTSEKNNITEKYVLEL